MQTPPSSDFIYNDIVNRIIELDIEPGAKISENKMCNEYKVSRSVIRNVFARLKQINFVEVYPQRGTFVTKIDLDYIHTILIMRLAIEKEMIVRFMKLDDKKDIIKKLRDNIKKQKKYSYTHKYINDFKKLDEEFHEIIMLSMEGYNVLDLMNEHLFHISRWRNVSVNLGDRVQELICEHEQIVDGIESGDSDKALQAITVHLDTVSGIVEILKKRYRNYLQY